MTYEEFIASIDAEDLFILALLSQGSEPGYIEPAGIADMEARMDRLLDAGYMIRPVHSREDKEDTRWHFFKGFVDPVIKGYCARVAKERVLLSRDPLPA